MIIDACIFFEEIEMLAFRLRYLYDYVDKFVIVESDHTFSGKPKRFNFLDNVERFEGANEKIVYYPLHFNASDMDTPDSHWKLESIQRNAIIGACGEFPGDATLMISDCDEVPDVHATTIIGQQFVCRQKLFYYDLNHHCGDWDGSIVTSLDVARANSLQRLRDARQRQDTVLANGGWHLSYFGSPAVIKHKIESFSHQEYNTAEFTDEYRIAQRIANHSDLFDRPVAMKKVPKESFPRRFIEFAPKEWWGDAQKTI